MTEKKAKYPYVVSVRCRSEREKKQLLNLLKKIRIESGLKTGAALIRFIKNGMAKK
jgi:hypothetical protein